MEIRHRLSGHLGAGYNLIKKDDLALDLLAGLGLSKEWDSPRTRIVPEGLLGAEIAWKPLEGHKLTASSMFYPELDHFGRYRLASKAAWNIDLAGIENLALSLGLEHDYESRVDPGRKKSDLRYTASLVFKF